MIVVQFTHLEEMLQEAADPDGELPFPLVRVEAMDHVGNTGNPALLSHSIGVQVSTLRKGEILSTFVLVAQLYLTWPSRQPPEQQAQYGSAWGDACELAHRIRGRIEERGLRSAAGVYDLGTAKVLQGVWNDPGRVPAPKEAP